MLTDRITKALTAPYYRRSPQQALLRLIRLMPFRWNDEQNVKLPWGGTISINIREQVGRALWETGLYDLPVTEVIWRLLSSGDVAVDAGANIGYLTTLMGKRVGPVGMVHAFEPHPALFARLARNLGGNMTNVILHQLAVSDTNGHGWLSVSSDWTTNNGTASLQDREAGNGFNIIRTTLDKALENVGRIALLKLDIEGHEESALHGAKTLIADRRIDFIVFEDYGGAESNVQCLLRNAGYTTSLIDSTNEGPLLRDASFPVRPDLAPNYVAALDIERLHSLVKENGIHSLGYFRRSE